MKPTRGFNQHVNSRDEIVTVANMRKLVQQDRFELFAIEPFGKRRRPHQNGTQDSKDAGLHYRLRTNERDRLSEADNLFEPPQCFEFRSSRHSRRVPRNRSYSPPSDEPSDQYRRETAHPYGKNN